MAEEYSKRFHSNKLNPENKFNTHINNHQRSSSWAKNNRIEVPNQYSVTSDYKHSRHSSSFQRTTLNLSVYNDKNKIRPSSPSTTKLASDSYFENKRKKNNKEKPRKVDPPMCKLANNVVLLDNLKFYANKIIENIERVSQIYRHEERNLYLCVIILLDMMNFIDYEEVSDENIINTFESVQFYNCMASNNKNLFMSLFDNPKYIERISMAHNFYGKICSTLYGYDIVNYIYYFITINFQLSGQKFKNLTFIDYFEEFITPQRLIHKRRNIEKKKFNNSDPIYETTKDDEDTLYIISDSKDYHSSFEQELQVIYTEANSKEQLIHKFYRKFSKANPYEFEKNSINLVDNKAPIKINYTKPKGFIN